MSCNSTCDEDAPHGELVSPQRRAHLDTLRGLMAERDLDLYLIQTADAHQSEEIRECDKRREFISGFDGSAATCAVSATDAILFTDGRYWLQARKQISPDWVVQRCPLSTWLATYSRSVMYNGNADRIYFTPYSGLQPCWALPVSERLHAQGVSVLNEAPGCNCVDRIIVRSSHFISRSSKSR